MKTQKKGYIMGEKEIRIICYADVIITAENQRLFEHFKEISMQYNMMISTERANNRTSVVSGISGNQII